MSIKIKYLMQKNFCTDFITLSIKKVQKKQKKERLTLGSNSRRHDPNMKICKSCAHMCIYVRTYVHTLFV